MIDPRVQDTFAALQRHSRVSLFMVVLGAVFLVGSVYYSATRLRPLEDEIAARRAELQKLAAEEVAQRARVEALQQSYATLRASAEQLYSVRVTPDNQVYELKATAQATGRTLGSGPEYRFAIYVKGSPQTLESIRRVAYRFDHETFRQKDYVAEKAGDRFMMTYTGWGCLNSVAVTVYLKDGTEHPFDFDMCRSLGPQWD